MSHTIDNISQICLDFILHQLKQRPRSNDSARCDAPFFVGISGIQGSGKTTLVSAVAEELNERHSLPTSVLSIDDLYLPHDKQVELAAKYPDNPLIQHRGQPSTHDISLGVSFFSRLLNCQPTKIPAYDKSAFNGRGDRVPEAKWKAINQSGQPLTKVVILEGWCVGFRSLDRDELKTRWDSAVAHADRGGYQGRLGYARFQDIEFVNDALKKYDQLTNQLDTLIHIDAEDIMYAYQWRLEQEVALRKSKGSGMTDEQVLNFVNDYYPAYELFTDRLREGSMRTGQKAQLRLVIGKDRRIKQVLLV